MKSLLIVFFIVVLIFMIMLFPFKVRVATHINLLEYKAFYCFKVWRLKFLCGKAEIDSGKISVQNSNNMFAKDIDKDFAKELAKETLARLDVKKMEIFFTGGFEENSYASAMVCGTMTSLVRSAYSVLSQQYENVKLYEDIVPTFAESNLELTFDVVVRLSLFQIIISLLKAKIKINKMERIEDEG